MRVGHSHSTGPHRHSANCGCHRAWYSKTFSLPLGPLRWLVVGCVGLVALGAILPFSPIPPCPMLTATGIPCPFCGMTRSVRSLAQLDMAGSLRYQPFGAIALLCGFVLLLMWAIPKTRTVSAVRVPLVVVVIAVGVSWIWNIGFNPTFA